MHRSVIYFLICCVLGKSTSYGASVVVDSVGGHHVAVRKVVPEGSQVSLQCRVPVNSQLSRMMDLIEPSPVSNPVVWLRFDMKDPSNQEVISHGDTLLIDTNPRLRLAFQEDTRTSTLIVKSLFRLTEPKFKMEAYSNAKFSFETKSCPVLLSKW